MILPRKRTAPKMVNPKRLLLFGQPKSGKTTIINDLEDCLIVDTEKGSTYVNAMSVEVNTMDDFRELMKALKEAKDNNEGKVPYKFIAIDTLTAFEEISLDYARKLYNNTPMGAAFKGDVRTLPNGAGYLYVRQAFMKMLKPFQNYCETLIMVGHIKEKDITKDGEAMTEKSINLTGKLKDILCGWSDTIGLVYRDENKTMIDFAPSESLIVGSRQKHLIGNKICVATSNENNELFIDWGEIFITE
ncbi:MAG: AAA family ATPase [Bacteroidetes bacterium]|nr:AAA family ATPase [Bacteroidota bacterium]